MNRPNPARRLRPLVGVLAVSYLVLVLSPPAYANCHEASFSKTSYDVAENAQSVKIIVNREPTGCAGKVRYSTNDGSARAGADYEAAEGELVFTSSDNQETFDVKMRDDSAAEGNEAFTVSLSWVEGGIDTFPGSPATVTIVENDAAPAPPAAPPPPSPRASPTRAASPTPTPSPTPSPSPTESPTPTPTPTDRAAADGGGGPPLGVIIAIVAFVLAGGAGVALWYLRRAPA